MKKLLGYIPLEPGENLVALQRETDCVKIYDQWFKLAEVWIQGVGVTPPPKSINLAANMTFKAGAMEHRNRCLNCRMPREAHLGVNMICPAKGQKDLPGRKYD